MRLPSSQSRVRSREVDSSGHTRGTRIRSVSGQHLPIKRDVFGLAHIIQFFADTRTDLLVDFGGVDRGLHAPMQREQEVELLEIGFHRRLHVRILQLAGKPGAVMGARLVYLPERRGGRRLVFELREFRLPVGTKFRNHAPFDKGPAHRRRLALQLGEFGGVFRGQRVGDGGQKLRHLHDRALQPAERCRELRGILAAIEIEAKKARSGHPRGDAADIGSNARIAAGAGGKTVGFGIRHHRSGYAFVGAPASAHVCAAKALRVTPRAMLCHPRSSACRPVSADFCLRQARGSWL